MSIGLLRNPCSHKAEHTHDGWGLLEGDGRDNDGGGAGGSSGGGAGGGGAGGRARAEDWRIRVIGLAPVRPSDRLKSLGGRG